ncbi:prepilin peptidase [Candidatus Atribacteria bacterium CG2_30_33_13]|uniref:Prepilin leader peptidase/N-methyltransferase n=2 Tax=Candidatus Infernicultor aquiphilus TaxID=1805029 RepID=A0A1J5GSD9_9BACT|nr:MAG: prepilin peptidase [Candidatus Atribacteria bacterium CG2_30_33_13]
MYYGLNYILIFILGLIVGSFCNVCIYRIPKNESIIYPASHCPKCRTTIKPVDNIPLLSYILLKGRCRNCGSKISIQYPVVELLTGMIYLIIYLIYGLSIQSLIYIILSSALIIIAFIDLNEQIVPDVISLPGIGVGLILSFFVPYLSFINSALGVVVGGGIILIIALVGSMIFKKEAMGGGDVKLAAMIGAFLGWRYTIISLFLGFFLGALVGIFLVLSKIKSKEDMVPFGPFIALGSLITLLWGEKIIAWYWY